MSLTKEQQDSVNRIMRQFDFNKVMKVMTMLNWQWVNRGIPEMSDVQGVARGLLEGLFNKMGDDGDYVMETATGGFRAYRIELEDYVGIGLRFELETVEDVNWDEEVGV
jgi:hypothetical protein